MTRFDDLDLLRASGFDDAACEIVRLRELAKALANESAHMHPTYDADCLGCRLIEEARRD